MNPFHFLLLMLRSHKCVNRVDRKHKQNPKEAAVFDASRCLSQYCPKWRLGILFSTRNLPRQFAIIPASKTNPSTMSLMLTLGGLGKFSKVMQTRDVVSNSHNPPRV